jgi:methionyl-tRNA formyltransferase
MRVVFMGTPEFAVPSLEQLIREGYSIAAVYTQPDRPAGRGRALVEPPVKLAALKAGLTVVQPEDLRTEAAIRQLAELEPGIIVICAYGQILPKEVLDMPPHRCLNVHFSLLPRHRGASPVAAALLAGDDITGVTIMIVTPKLDTGPVLAQAAVTISPRDNAGTLTAKLATVGAGILLEALNGWLRGELMPRSQDESRATYFSQIRKEEGKIDWALPAVSIQRRVRAYNPWPGSYTTWRGRQLKIIEAESRPEENTPEAGRVFLTEGGEPGIGTGEGVLHVLRLQLEGKRMVSADEFLRGQRDFIGEKLPS